MKTKMMSLCFKIQYLLSREEGQDLVEYALIVSVIAFAAIAGMQTLAKDINNAFVSIGSTLTSSV